MKHDEDSVCEHKVFFFELNKLKIFLPVLAFGETHLELLDPQVCYEKGPKSY
jgi:hypothetical protein